jgi:hypothetical protein
VIAAIARPASILIVDATMLMRTATVGVGPELGSTPIPAFGHAEVLCLASEVAEK